jgi:hypothetical protein
MSSPKLEIKVLPSWLPIKATKLMVAATLLVTLVLQELPVQETANNKTSSSVRAKSLTLLAVHERVLAASRENGVVMRRWACKRRSEQTNFCRGAS